MKGNMERYQVVYSVLKTHIQFGIYGFGDVLPSIENAAADFFVSVDTMRAAAGWLGHHFHKYRDYGSQELRKRRN